MKQFLLTITIFQGEGLAKKIGAKRYLECSALTQENLSKVFEDAVKVVLFPNENNNNERQAEPAKTKEVKHGKEAKEKECIIQ